MPSFGLHVDVRLQHLQISMPLSPLGGLVTPLPVISAPLRFKHLMKIPNIRVQRPAIRLQNHQLTATLKHAQMGPSNLFQEAKKCTAQPKNVDELDTGGQCRWSNCHPSRGLTRCVSYKCLCLAGYRASEGKCVPKEGMRSLTA